MLWCHYNDNRLSKVQREVILQAAKKKKWTNIGFVTLQMKHMTLTDSKCYAFKLQQFCPLWKISSPPLPAIADSSSAKFLYRIIHLSIWTYRLSFIQVVIKEITDWIANGEDHDQTGLVKKNSKEDFN